MSSKIGILSFHYIANNGAFLFAYSLQKLLQREFSNSTVNLIDYKSTRLYFYEKMKRFKVFQRVPLFYFKRSELWNRVLHNHLVLDDELPRNRNAGEIQQYLGDQYDMLVVGMDIWCILSGTERPLFPNIYWLPQKMEIPKCAYGVSAYNSDPILIKRHADEIGRYLDEFEVIGCRDRFTLEMVQTHRSRTGGLVSRVPDPAFSYQIRPTRVADKLTSIGVDLNRPILGLLLFGDDQLSRHIQSHYHSKGYQILAMSMYNPYVDFNLGHRLDPFEWAEAFRFLTFCITDRFHGTVFSIKNQIPFISLEKDRALPLSQSKLYDLLLDFDLTPCYQNPCDASFEAEKLLDQADEIEQGWENSLKPRIKPVLNALEDRRQDFNEQMKAILL